MRTVFYNGCVYTGEMPLAQAFVVEDARFIFAGTDAEALAYPADDRVDLGGAFVCPGFNDSHMHVLNFGQSLSFAPLAEHTGSLADMLDCLSKAEPSRGGWILGRGWNQDLFEDVHRMPDRYDLDRVSTERPVCIIRACGHALSVNSRALELLGITADTPQLPGGEIVMKDGQPNGVFLDSTMQLVLDAIPAPDMEAVKGMIRRACRELNANGITSCHSDDYPSLNGVSWQTVNEAYRQLEREGSLTVRVYEQANFNRAAELEAFISESGRKGSEGGMFRIGPLKLLCDGALGAHTAYLSVPYADDPSAHGLCLLEKEELDALISVAHRNGMQVAAHCIGDACLDQVLDGIERAMTAQPREDCRHGIIHCQITRPDQLDRMAGLKLNIHAQSIFLDYDIHIVRQRVGDDLAESSYSWRTLMEKGCSVSNGSDCPVEYPRVMAGIQCAVTRCDLKGFGPYLPEEAFTVKEALDSFTKAGAFASFEEQVKGKIASGMLADFVVLGGNPFETDPSALAQIPVLQTWLGGKMVYEA